MSLQLRNGYVPNTLVGSAYVLGCGEYRTAGGPTHEGWTENIERDAILKAIAARPNVRVRVDGCGFAVARTSDGTLSLNLDAHGLMMTATMLATVPEVAGLRGGEHVELAHYTVTADHWNSDRTHRTVTGLSFDGYDVTIYP